MLSFMTIEPENGGAVHYAVFLLQGSHSLGDAFAWGASKLKEILPNTVFILPKAPIPVDEKGDRCSWYLYGEGEEPALNEMGRQLNECIDNAAKRYDIDFKNIAIVGFSQGMALAFNAVNEREHQVGAVVGFSGFLHRSMTGGATKVKPNTLLIHGESDEAIRFSELSKSESQLRMMGYPVLSFSLPALGHWVDEAGLQKAGEFIKESLPYNKTETAKTLKDVLKKIKLIIWDLDETLWAGTLAEQDAITPNAFRFEVIKKLNGHGIVSAISSKNDYDSAKNRLIELGFWEDFVFPKISFIPKGQVVKDLIEEMQLRASNVLFIDDNVNNLEEAISFCPGIHTLNAKSEECDKVLLSLVATHSHVNKSRVEEYRALQTKAEDRVASNQSSEEFLRACDIHVCVLMRSDTLDFSRRIEELINRTNQLNYTKSRVVQGSMDAFLAEPVLRESYVVFAWDKYGYHGLVGFAATDVQNHRLLHMTFSCRIMHMGIEGWLLNKIIKQLPLTKIPDDFPVKPSQADWITEERFSDAATRHLILSQEKKNTEQKQIELRVMAHCHSGAFAHFSGLRDITEIDNYPRAFSLSHMLDERYIDQNYPPYLVYTIQADYFNELWQEEVLPMLETGLYEVAVTKFCELTKAMNARVLVIPTPRGIPDHMYHPDKGITFQRVELFTLAWEKAAHTYSHIDLLDIEKICSSKHMLDVAHFSIDTIRKIAKEISVWYANNVRVNSTPRNIQLPA